MILVSRQIQNGTLMNFLSFTGCTRVYRHLSGRRFSHPRSPSGARGKQQLLQPTDIEGPGPAHVAAPLNRRRLGHLSRCAFGRCCQCGGGRGSCRLDDGAGQRSRAGCLPTAPGPSGALSLWCTAGTFSLKFVLQIFVEVTQPIKM